MTAPVEQPQYLSTCPACEGVLDVTAFEPYSKVVCPNCGQSVRVRRKFDHFLISRQIGEGGMSRVFESSDQLLGRSVALKILNRHYSRDSARMAQFEREAQLTAAVTHPHVVKLFSVGRDQGNFYIAMELVAGGSLEQRIHERERIPEEEALRVGRAVAEGLRAAYREGLIHRDVKPANILFTEDGTPKIVDFGLALFHERDIDDSGEIWATPYYVAPEKVIEDREDFRSDMFSLGATLFHALTGVPPHKANTNSLSELKVIKSAPVKLEQSGLRFSPRTCELVDRLLALRPEDRFQSYDELVEAFRDTESMLGYAIRGSRSRRQKLVFAAIGGAAALVALLSLLPRSGERPQPKAVNVNSGVAATEISDLAGTLASGARSAAEVFRSARETLVEGKIDEARKMFDEIIRSALTKPYTRNMARFNAALCAIVSGRRDEATAYFRDIRKDADEEVDVGGEDLKRFFSRFGGRMAGDLGLEARLEDAESAYHRNDEEALAYLVHGLAQWHFGDPLRAADWIEAFDACETGRGFEWIGAYKKLAAPYLEDARVARSLGALDREPVAGIEAARMELKRNQAALAALKTTGSLRQRIGARVRFVQDEMARLRREEAQRLAARDRETRERELAQLGELTASLPSLAHGYDFRNVVELLRDIRFETPEVQGAVANKFYLWSKALEFMEQLAADVNAAGVTGTIARRTGPPLQGRLSKMDHENVTIAFLRGEIVVPLDSVTPASLVQLAQQFVSQVRDSADYYRRQELIAVFAKMQGLDQMAHTVAAQLMEENRAFRQRWTRVEQGGS